jgi:hypothetical protein
LFGWVPTTHPAVIAGDTLRWNYTTVLDIIALVVFGLLYWLYRNRERFGAGTGYANDPVCGMQIEIARAPASIEHPAGRLYFCSERCRNRFASEAARSATGAADAGAEHHFLPEGTSSPPSPGRP